MRLIEKVEAADEETQVDFMADIDAAMTGRSKEEILEDLHAAFHLATKLEPGESCPVCAQLVPPDFKSRTQDPSEKELIGAKAATEAAEHAYQMASGESAEAKTASRMAQKRLAEERKKLSSIGEVLRDTMGLEVSHEHLEQSSGAPGSLFKPLEERVKDLGKLRTEAEQSERALGLSAGNLRVEIEGLAGNLRRDEERLVRDLERLETRRKSLPQGFRPPSLEVDLDPLQGPLNQRLEEVRGLKERETKAQSGLEEVRKNLETLRQRREAEILRPRRGAREATISLARDLEDAGKEVETRPDEDAPLEKQIRYVDDLLHRARTLAGELEDIVKGADKRLEAENERLVNVLRRDADVKNVDELQRMHDEARGQLTALRQRVKAAGERLPEWRRVLEHIDETRKHQSTYEELARLLTDAKFVKYVVHRRQQALLGLASQIFKGMTNGRYGFSEDFEVVVTESEQPRPSVTLSGGETFLASLPLALGLMELAGRSGGRLESFFLDEGFGSLDAVTLDLALAELGRRASRGRLVALISHVPAVAENIDDVLRVRRAPDGNSEASWLEPSGEQEVDVELMKAALTATERI